MEIEHHIFINCPADKVWKTTLDINTWPNWAPTVQSALRLDQGAFGMGSTARIKQPLQPGTIWRVTAFEEGRFFAWETSGSLFQMRAAHSVFAREGGTDCKLTIKLIGPLTKLLGPLIRFPMAKALKQENEGLKDWCERNSST